MYLEIPKKLQGLIDQAHLVGQEVFRPISRKYDLAEHEYPKELDMLAAVMDGMSEGDANMNAGAGKLRQEKKKRDDGVRNGTNGVQLLGGHGFTKEHPVERWYRDLRAISLMEGGVLV